MFTRAWEMEFTFNYGKAGNPVFAVEMASQLLLSALLVAMKTSPEWPWNILGLCWAHLLSLDTSLYYSSIDNILLNFKY